MSSIAKEVIDYLLAESTVTDIVGQKIRPNKMSEDDRAPMIRVQVISDRPVHHLGGRTGQFEAEVQLDLWGTTAKEAKDLKEAIEALSVLSTGAGTIGALTGVSIIITDQVDEIPEEPDVPSDVSDHRVTQTLELIY